MPGEISESLECPDCGRKREMVVYCENCKTVHSVDGGVLGFAVMKKEDR